MYLQQNQIYKHRHKYVIGVGSKDRFGIDLVFDLPNCIHFIDCIDIVVNIFVL